MENKQKRDCNNTRAIETAAAIQTQQSRTRTFKSNSDSSNSGDCAHTLKGNDSDSDDDSDAVIACTHVQRYKQDIVAKQATTIV